MSKTREDFLIRSAKPEDEAIIVEMIQGLALYEKAPEQCFATVEKVRAQIFGPHPAAEVILAFVGDEAVGMTLFFQTFSTWVCKPGLYLEDLFVKPEYRKRGIGGALLRRLAAIAVERDYGRIEWACLEWNELAKEQYRKMGAAPLEAWRTWRLSGEDIKAFADS
ncbi:GNAT family N-acetyltransferase [soil metagenome]